MAHEQVLRRPHDMPLLLCGHGPGGTVERLALLDLHEHEAFALQRHEVDLAHWQAVALRDDPVALEVEQEYSERLGKTPRR